MNYNFLKFVSITARPAGHKRSKPVSFFYCLIVRHFSNSFNLQILIRFSPTCKLFYLHSILYLVKDTIQRRSIDLTYRVWIKTCASSYFLQMLFWVDITISSQSSFDKIVTSYFRPSLRRRRDKNWLHIKDRSLTFSRTVSLSNAFMYVLVGLPLAARPCVGTHLISWIAPITQNMSR